jgi:hypothetical protein
MSEEHKHEWKEEYYGIRCAKCDLFYPDNGNYFAPPDEEEDEKHHSYDCTCENCLQNHPERDILYGDGEYFNYPEDETDETNKKCGWCGEMNRESNSFCWNCEGEI